MSHQSGRGGRTHPAATSKRAGGGKNVDKLTKGDHADKPGKKG